MTDKKKYNYMENTLNSINKNVISLPENEIKRNNAILQALLDLILQKMKQNTLFKQLYQRVFYGGSFYDGLRIQKPDEFDLDLLMKIPDYAKPVLITSNSPGFVHLKVTNLDGFMKQPEAKLYYNKFDSFFDNNGYLDTKKIKSWMESVLTVALNLFPTHSGAEKIISTSQFGDFYVYVKKGGPALTLIVRGPNRFNIDIDLVPCFVFADMWPQNGFISNPVKNKPGFFIVPKEPKGLSQNDVGISARYWRLSFQEQERELMNGKKTLKPTIKLFKLLRDNLDHKTIASYYIKTVVLHFTSKQSNDFWNNSLSYTFMEVFKEYLTYLEKQNIPYFWNKNNNLIKGANTARLVQIHSQMKKIYNDIERNINDPSIVEKYLVPNNIANQMAALRL